MKAHTALVALAILASAWSAGFFWTWSFSVMPGLSAAPPHVAIEAMRAANANIRTVFFAFVFFGPLPLSILAGAAAWFAGERTCGGAALAAAAAYAVGVIVVTFIVNVPLNNALADAPVTTSSAAATWLDYARPWTAWNNVRVSASTATLLLLVLGVLLGRR
jgi:uncharacterized membrane protein